MTSTTPTIEFAEFADPAGGSVIVLSTQGQGAGRRALALDPEGVIARAEKTAGFKGKLAGRLDVLAPAGTAFDRLGVVGIGKPEELDTNAWLRVGGTVKAIAGSAKDVTVVLDPAGVKPSAQDAADLALGILLRAYAFDKYKTRKGKDKDKDEEEAKDDEAPARFTVRCADPEAARTAFETAGQVAGGVRLARDLVNEPANKLGPEEFAAAAGELSKLGVKVEVLGEKEMTKLGMGALLGVAQGSARPPRLVVMQWNGGAKGDAPLAFVGKGVVFDSGGISIKPAAGMEDMKGDMGGAAAVTGLMHALAARKAKANVVGVIGLVENMLDGNAQRPGDIVTSMSGQTIEVLNTDAEGRLVLADALWYCDDRFKPRFIVDLATLTGAVIVALGQHHAGLFASDDELADRIAAAGKTTGEKVWRMPLGPEYDKMIDSKNADMKNIGGRYGGAITAAQFLKRFVRETPWAHLDVAGTAMGSPTSEFSQSWASGFGVRLLDRLVADHYEN